MSLNILFNKSAINSLVFVDFISVTKYPNLSVFKGNDPVGYNLWLESFLKNEEEFKGTPDDYYHTKSCFNPLYSTMVGAAIGAFEDGKEILSIKPLVAANEQKLLGALTSVFYRAYDKDKILCGHNIIGYHIPFYTKRLLSKENANKVIAKGLNNEQVIAGIPAIISEHLVAKPWEHKTMDTMNTIKFGSFYNTSLEQILYHFDLDTEKILSSKKESLSEKYWQAVSSSTDSIENAVAAENAKMSIVANDYVSATMSVYLHLRNAI